MNLVSNLIAELPARCVPWLSSFILLQPSSLSSSLLHLSQPEAVVGGTGVCLNLALLSWAVVLWDLWDFLGGVVEDNFLHLHLFLSSCLPPFYPHSHSFIHL